jgi:PAS domain S-box-containing protein
MDHPSATISRVRSRMVRQQSLHSYPSILIVDDDLDISLALCDMLEYEGYRVQSAATGNEALAKVADTRFDALLLDLGLPDLDGFSVLETITERDPKLPIIVLTAFATEEKTIGSLRRGAFGYLKKPYNKEELKAVLHRAVGFTELTARAEQVERALGDSEERCRESERQYRLLMEEASDGIFIGDLDGTLIMANSKACEMMGYRREELQGRHITETYAPEETGAALERLAAIRAGSPLRFERLMRRKDGGHFPVEVSLTKVSDNRLLGIVRDITERKQAEEVLRFQKTLLEAQSETSLDGMLVVSPEGTLMSHNRRFIEMWDIPPDVLTIGTDEAALQSVRDKLVDPDAFLARVKYLYEHPEETSFDELRLKDGRVFDRYSAPIRSHDGRHYGRVWYVRDVTARRRAEEQLQISETRYRLAIKSARGVVWDWDIASGTVIWSESLQTSFGYGQDEPGSSIEASYRWWSHHVHPSDRPWVLRSVEETIQPAGGEVWSMEYRFQKADRSYAVVLDQGYVARDEHGHAVRMIGSMHDITMQKRAEEELRKRDEHLLQAMKAVGMVAWEWDPATDQVIRYGQPAAITGLPGEPSRGTAKQFFDLIHPNDRDRVHAIIHASLESRTDYEAEFRIIREDGGLRWVVDRGQVLTDPEGRIRVMGITLDVTERKKSEEERTFMKESDI